MIGGTARAAHRVLSKTGFRGNVCGWTVRALQDEQLQGVAGPATGPSVHTLSLSLCLSFSSERERGSRKRGDNGGTALCADRGAHPMTPWNPETR